MSEGHPSGSLFLTSRDEGPLSNVVLFLQAMKEPITPSAFAPLTHLCLAKQTWMLSGEEALKLTISALLPASQIDFSNIFQYFTDFKRNANMLKNHSYLLQFFMTFF